MAEIPGSTAANLSKAASISEDASIAGNAVKFGFRRGVGALSHFGGIWLGISTVATAALSQWDHHTEKKRIAGEYDQEIGSMLGKKPGKVDIDDMEKAAKENPAIKEALRRSTTKRNLSMAVTVVAAVAAVALLAPLAMAAVPAGIVAHSLVVGGLTALGFLGVEKGLEAVGEKVFHVEDASFKKVDKDPGKQSELSVPDQVTYLGKKQAQGQTVTQEQVMTVFTSANKGLGAQIEARYGKPFAQLEEPAKRDALRQFGSKYHVAEITADINNHNMRAQELAFNAYGQASGVAKTGSSRVEATQRQADALNAQLTAEAPLTNAEMKKEKLGFAKSSVSATPASVQQEQAEAPVQEETAWRRRIDAQRSQQGPVAVVVG